MSWSSKPEPPSRCSTSIPSAPVNHWSRSKTAADKRCWSCAACSASCAPDEEASLSPQPSLRHLDGLAGQVRDAGLPVAVLIEGALDELPSGVDLAAYRIVQEALTNTLKPAGPATATVVLRYSADTLDIDVVDDGQVPLDVTPDGTGNGLIGMRDRVSLYGGEFDAGPRPHGGFRVHARLPLGGRSP